MSQIIPLQVKLKVDESETQYGLRVADNNVPISLGVSTQIVAGASPAYDGPYSVTPSEAVQTLATTELRMTDNITINPIPNNYGLITWNGSTITVS